MSYHCITISITISCPFPAFFLQHLPLVTAGNRVLASQVLTGHLVSSCTALMLLLLEHICVSYRCLCIPNPKDFIFHSNAQETSCSMNHKLMQPACTLCSLILFPLASGMKQDTKDVFTDLNAYKCCMQ